MNISWSLSWTTCTVVCLEHSCATVNSRGWKKYVVIWWNLELSKGQHHIIFSFDICIYLFFLHLFTFFIQFCRRLPRGQCRCGPTQTASWRSSPILCMSTTPTMCSSLQSAYDTWSFGLVTTSAGILAWDLRCVEIVYHSFWLFFMLYPLCICLF